MTGVAEISAALVKELREATGAGMMDCKRALVETGGDLEAARTLLRGRSMLTSARSGLPVVVFVTVPVSEPTAVAWRGAGCCATARAPTAPATTVTAVTSAVEVRRMRRNEAVGEEASVLPVPEPFDPSLA